MRYYGHMANTVSPEKAHKIVNAFLPSQEVAPLSSGYTVKTALGFLDLIEGGMRLSDVAQANPFEHPMVFEDAVEYTVGIHQAVGVRVPEDAVRAELPWARGINAAIAVRAIASAATGAEWDEDVNKVDPHDAHIVDAEAVLARPEGLARTRGVLAEIAECALNARTPSGQRSLFKDYREAVKGNPSELFSEWPPADLSRREHRRRTLMGHLAHAYGKLAEAVPETEAAVRALLQDKPGTDFPQPGH